MVVFARKTFQYERGTYLGEAQVCEYPDCGREAVMFGAYLSESEPGEKGYRLDIIAAVYEGFIFVCENHKYLLKDGEV